MKKKGFIIGGICLAVVAGILGYNHEAVRVVFHNVYSPIIIFVFLLLTRFFSHFHFFIEITSKSMSFPLAINHGYTDV